MRYLILCFAVFVFFQPKDSHALGECDVAAIVSISGSPLGGIPATVTLLGNIANYGSNASLNWSINGIIFGILGSIVHGSLLSLAPGCAGSSLMNASFFAISVASFGLSIANIVFVKEKKKLLKIHQKSSHTNIRINVKSVHLLQVFHSPKEDTVKFNFSERFTILSISD